MADPIKKEAQEKLLRGYDRLVAKGYAKKPDMNGTGYPVAIVHGDAVPMRDARITYWGGY